LKKQKKHTFRIITGFLQYFDMDSPYPIAMTTDKVFILLLVIMLPLTGCLDMTDNAEAEDSDEENTIINNYYNNTTTVVQHASSDVKSFYIPPGGNLTLSFDGTFTYKLESLMKNQTGDGAPLWTEVVFLTGISMECNGTMILQGLYITTGESFLPVLPNQICIVEIDYSGIMVFSQHTLS
jgi:hypothetical protein